MKKHLTTILTLIVCICFLSACGDSDYVGEWRTTKASRGDTEISIEQLEKLTGGALKLFIDNDGTAHLETGGTDSEPVKWEETGDGILLYEDGDKDNGTSYTYKDGQLLVQDPTGLEMVLEKQ